MGKATKSKYYVVWEGRIPGIYTSWDDASRHVLGYPGAKFKGFSSRNEAESAFKGQYSSYAGNGPKASKPARPTRDQLEKFGVIFDSVAVDAACAGVPGPMEYRGVDVATGDELFHFGPFEDGTNNIGEFLAIVQALEYLRESKQPRRPIYSDSVNAQLWIRAGKCRTNLQPSSRNAPIFELIAWAERWLAANSWSNPVLKWETSAWGEIPADFGRK